MAAMRCWLLSAGNILNKIVGHNQVALRGIGVTAARQCTAAEDGEGGDNSSAPPQRLVVDPETSIRYMESKAYSEAYGDKPVWFYYRRNFKGQRAPETRKTCIRKGEIDTGSPCPVCRDEYLVLDYKNVKLLEQFISPYTGEVLDTRKTGVCQKQHKKLVIEVMKAQKIGLLETNVPFREYDYSQYWDADKGQVL